MKIFLTLLFSVFLVSSAQAQGSLPEIPKPIQNLVDEGAQIRYLGRDHGLDAWITIKQGQEQYFYVMPGGKAFVMGLLFDDSGKVVTVDQVRKLQEQDGGALDVLADDFGFDPTNTRGEQESLAFKSPSEQLYYNIENSNWVPLGEPGAPILYAFIDPQCPHCHAFIGDIREQIEAGDVQLRMVMVGFREQTRAQSAFLLAAPDAQARWFAHMDSEENALPVRQEINQQGVQRNLALMQSWQFNATPLIVYRGKDNSVKIVRGRPKDPASLIADLGVRS